MSGAGASWPALGTTASLIVTRDDALEAARAAVESELAEVDASCSRFRADSELMRVNAGAGSHVAVGPLLLAAIEVAVTAARMTDGLVDPTVGAAMDAIGYDRDLASVAPDGPPIVPAPVSGWRSIEIDRERRTVRVPRGVRLDLGATAKAWAADRAARRAAEAVPGAGVLVSLGGDIALGGPVPANGWAIGVGDDHAETAGGPTIALSTGGLATSSTTVRHWRRGGDPVHHIVDPATGRPARVVWRTVTVAAASCVDANTASTAAIVRGEDAPDWLSHMGLPSRLVSADGRVLTLAGWPAAEAAA
ncbi:MAG: FAD:protein transferase [Thermoleophilaceae bacterium]|nr:FAD:protein transferase [Thermoleophilaceae bacterium]